MSRVAAVHTYSRTKLCTPTHVDQAVPLYTKNEEQPKLGAWYSSSRGMGLLKRWVVVRVACQYSHDLQQ